MTTDGGRTRFRVAVFFRMTKVGAVFSLVFSRTGFSLSSFRFGNFRYFNSKADRLKPVLLWAKRQAVYGFCDYVFLDLDQVRIRPRHS
jgi:hypothetical protein